jgi:hypothetical protein
VIHIVEGWLTGSHVPFLYDKVNFTVWEKRFKFSYYGAAGWNLSMQLMVLWCSANTGPDYYASHDIWQLKGYCCPVFFLVFEITIFQEVYYVRILYVSLFSLI